MALILTFAFSFLIKLNQALFSTNRENNPKGIFCLYEYKFQPDSTSMVKKTEIARLTITPNTSLFEGQSNFRIDSLVALPKLTQASVNLLTSYVGSDITYKIYKIKPSNKIKQYDKIGKTVYEINQNNNTLKWSISSETQNIGGYNCRQAATWLGGRKWNAWFTTEVPVSDGPYKFSGLPGLILRITDEQGYHTFNLIKLSHINTLPIISTPINTISISSQQFVRAKENYFFQKVDEFLSSRETPEQKKQSIEQYKQKQARKNNPIERS